MGGCRFWQETLFPSDCPCPRRQPLREEQQHTEVWGGGSDAYTGPRVSVPGTWGALGHGPLMSKLHP